MFDFNENIKLTDCARIGNMRARLGNYASIDILGMVRDAYNHDGSFDFVNVYEMGEICESMSAEDAIRAMFYGNVETLDGLFRFDAYGNLESVTEDQLIDECWDVVDELVDWLFDGGWKNTWHLYDEEHDLFDIWEDIDMGIYEEE